MNILSAENLVKSYGDKVLLDHVSFGVETGERIGLIGVNGTGKSSLLKMIAGEDAPDEGAIVTGRGMRIHYLPQEPRFAAGSTVLQAVFDGDIAEMQLLCAYEEAVEALRERPEAADRQARLLSLQSQMDQSGAWQLETDAKAVLSQLGLTDVRAIVDSLSGGQRKRIALARALIYPADLLILDEPTNHVDSQTVQWLENYLQKRKGALLMVTHDRYFLDRVVTRIIELDGGTLYHYPGNYSLFLEAKLAREAQAEASEEKRQNFLRNELVWIRRGPKARGTKQKARTDNYYEVLEHAPDAGAGTLEMGTASTRLGRTVVELEGVTKSFGGRLLIQGFNFIVQRRDRIGIVGSNGVGKSTLLNMMAGQLEPDAGRVVIGQTVNMACFGQEYEEPSGDVRVIDYIREVQETVEAADGTRITAAQMLERFLFPGPVQWTPIAKLSGGEKRRLTLLRTLMAAPNVLLLDEPTNDLDVTTLTILESYLDDFAGAVIVVSHDRYFLDRVTDKILAMEGDGQATVYFGNYSDFLEKRIAGGAGASGEAKRARANAVGAATSQPEPGTGQSARPERRAVRKFTFKEQREFEGIDVVIETTELALAQVNQEMNVAGGDAGKLQELYEEQQTLETKLEQLVERWAYLNELAEETEQGRKS